MIFENSMLNELPAYVHSIDYDASEHCLTINLIRDPEQAEISVVLTFSNVHMVLLESGAQQTTEEDNVLDTLIGFDAYSKGNGMTHYVVHTQKQELVFSTNIPAQVHTNEYATPTIEYAVSIATIV